MRNLESEALKVEVHTEERTVLGAIRTRHERLKDVLENWLHPFLPLEEAVVLHRDPSGKAIREEVRSVMVHLEEIVIAMPYEPIPTDDRSHDGLGGKNPPRLWGPRLARETLFLSPIILDDKLILPGVVPRSIDITKPRY